MPKVRTKLRQREKLALKYKLLAVFALFVVLVSALVYVSRLPALQVQAINIIGTKTISASAVEALVNDKLAEHYLWLVPKSNFLLNPKSDLVAGVLESFPRAESVDVGGGFDKSLDVQIVEHEPRYIWCKQVGANLYSVSRPSGGECLFLTSTGLAFSPAPHFSGSPYLTISSEGNLVLDEFLLARDEFENLVETVSVVEDIVGEVFHVHLLPHQDASLRLSRGFNLLYNREGARDDLSRNMQATLSTVLSSERDLRYVDYRFGSKVYYKYSE